MNHRALVAASRILLVEGPDDEHVVRHLLRRYGRHQSLVIQQGEGDTGVLAEIPVRATAPDTEILGIILDADDQPTNRWQAITDRLREVGVETPAEPNPNGTIIEATDAMPRIGIWMMPDNRLPGELEDFVAKMIPDDDPVWPLSQDYIDDIPAEQRKFAVGKTLRAKLHAWLATRQDPRQMGVAIRTRDLEIHGPLCTHFSDWLDRLFVFTAQL